MVLRPFDEFKSESKFKYLNLIKLDSESIQTADLFLDHSTSIIPFKPYFGNLYEFANLNSKIEYLIRNYDYIESSDRKFYLKSNYGFENLIDMIDPKIIYDYKLYISLTLIPKLISHIDKHNGDYELLLPFINNLLDSSHTCIDTVEFLFGKFAKKLSTVELTKIFMPTILSLLSVTELDFIEFDEMQRVKLSKLFSFGFLNQLRIYFGMEIFCNQIIPLMVEAISGLKDGYKHASTNKEKNSKRTRSPQDELFEMEKSYNDTNNSEYTRLQLNKQDSKVEHTSFYIPNENDDPNYEDSVTDSQEYQTISKLSFDSFKRMIPLLGPVITCKYFCKNLLKMLALCFINPKCLNISKLGNPLNSLKPIEGDYYALNILEALKSVAVGFV